MTNDNWERYFRSALGSYRNMPDWEDAVQEALIYFWQTEKKYPDLNQRKAYSVYRGRSIVTNQTGAQGGATMTGHIERKSTVGVRRKQGDLTREKIQVYIEEFKSLHNRKPTNKEITLGTGIPLYSVGKHLKVMATCGMSVPPQDVKLSALFISDRDDDGSDTSLAVERSAVQWEADAVDKVLVEKLLTSLTDRQRQAVYATYWLGMTTREMGDSMGISAKNARDHLKAAHTNMRKAYERTV